MAQRPPQRGRVVLSVLESKDGGETTGGAGDALILGISLSELGTDVPILYLRKLRLRGKRTLLESHNTGMAE